jgi:NifB/MoaA-like Fe-S oxidoreductase
MAPFMEDLAPSLRQATGASVQVSPVANEFFGPSVTVAGLLAGQDLLLAVPPDVGSEDVILVPAEALNADDLFIDSMSLSDFRKVVAPARVMAGLEITEALRKL